MGNSQETVLGEVNLIGCWPVIDVRVIVSLVFGSTSASRPVSLMKLHADECSRVTGWLSPFLAGIARLVRAKDKAATAKDKAFGCSANLRNNSSPSTSRRSCDLAYNITASIVNCHGSVFTMHICREQKSSCCNEIKQEAILKKVLQGSPHDAWLPQDEAETSRG